MRFNIVLSRMCPLPTRQHHNYRSWLRTNRGTCLCCKRDGKGAPLLSVPRFVALREAAVLFFPRTAAARQSYPCPCKRKRPWCNVLVVSSPNNSSPNSLEHLKLIYSSPPPPTFFSTLNYGKKARKDERRKATRGSVKTAESAEKRHSESTSNSAAMSPCIIDQLPRLYCIIDRARTLRRLAPMAGGASSSRRCGIMELYK